MAYPPAVGGLPHFQPCMKITFWTAVVPIVWDGMVPVNGVAPKEILTPPFTSVLAWLVIPGISSCQLSMLPMIANALLVSDTF